MQQSAFGRLLLGATLRGNRARETARDPTTRQRAAVVTMPAMPELRFTTPSGELGGYLATPSGEGPHAGVVVIQDALGLSDDIRAQADRLAAAGYLAFAPDLYSGRGIRCVVATLSASRSGSGPAYEEIEAARQVLAEREDCTGRIGIIGFCMGGGFALLCAPRGFQAARSTTARCRRTAAARRRVPGRRQLRREGPHPAWSRATAPEALDPLGVAHDVKEYPQAGHSFLNQLKVGPLTPLLHVTGFGYDEEAAENAWQRILAFFGEYLG